MEEFMWIVWLSLMVIMVFIEALGPALVSIWFAIGALAALIVSFIPKVPFWVEIIVFVVVSLIALITIRPISKKLLKRNTVKSNVDSYVGKRGLLQEEISPFSAGSCKINDVLWTAVSKDDKETIAQGSVVEVVTIVGNKLVVKKVEEK